MNKRLVIAVLGAIVLLIGSTAAMAVDKHTGQTFTQAQIDKILNAGNYWDGTPANVGDPCDIVLKDKAGNPVFGAGAPAYSPKQTCGKCHQYENANASGVYDIVTTTNIPKYSVIDGVTHNYIVHAATQGITSGYHFSEGLNEPWTANEIGYYGLPSFTSSPGMVGKF